MEKESNAIQFYREELKRIAWRLQYKSKVTLKRELPLELDHIHSKNFTEYSDNKIFIQQLINSISSDIGKKIIKEIYFNDKTEAQVAKEMNISQQAVNKWKTKILHSLYQKLSSKTYYR
ncbi:hypothetical protein V6C32_06200 [Desulforamulus ruminis]|uniref:hypothetical protein n=1 Tax=Desulforamulus ruminis TaxID=1564 RepID=UPI002FD99BFF